MRNVNLPFNYIDYQSHQFERGTNEWARIEGVNDLNLSHSEFELSSEQVKEKSSQITQAMGSLKKAFGFNRKKAA